jgi:hypothetical protein
MMYAVLVKTVFKTEKECVRYEVQGDVETVEHEACDTE